jgi:hypothetical protein
MPTQGRFASIRPSRSVATILLGIQLSSCVSWQPLPEPTPVFLAAEEPDRIRVTTAEGQQLILNNPRVISDTIVGTEDQVCTPSPVAGAPYTCSEPVVDARVALSDVATAESQVSKGFWWIYIGATALVLLILRPQFGCGAQAC